MYAPTTSVICTCCGTPNSLEPWSQVSMFRLSIPGRGLGSTAGQVLDPTLNAGSTFTALGPLIRKRKASSRSVPRVDGAVVDGTDEQIAEDRIWIRNARMRDPRDRAADDAWRATPAERLLGRQPGFEPLGPS